MRQPNPLVPWMGGKRRFARRLLPLFPPHVCYVEPFAGGAGLLFSKQPSEVEVINDVHGELINLYRVVQHHIEELLRQFKWALVSRQVFAWCRMQRPETLTDVQRAARFMYLMKAGFGGKADAQTFGVATTAPPRLNLLRIEEELSAAHLRLAQVTIEHGCWSAVVERYDRPHSFFFMDPPYWQVAGYGVPFDLEQYHRIAQTLRSMKGRALVTVNDHPDMRSVFAGFRIEEMPVTYTPGGGKNATRANELIIANWPA